MGRVVRLYPFREMVSVRNQMDQIIGDLLREPTERQSNGNRSYIRLALDVSEDDHTYNVKASLPGIDPADFEVSFSENTLTIQGERPAGEVAENAKWRVRERYYGRFMRSITLPAAINGDNISADYEGGVLSLTLPKAEEVKPRKIAVRPTGEEAVAA